MKIVLDTNVVLDWLLFNDSATHALQSEIQAGRLAIVSNDLSLEELRRVLAYAKLGLITERRNAIVQQYVRQTAAVDMPAGFGRDNLALPPGFPLCRDSDDNHFLSLALHARAAAVVTKDKQLLKLGKKTLRYGFRVIGLPELDALLRLPE